MSWRGGLIRAWSKTMPTLAMSTGESELGAVAKGAAEGAGIQSILEDFQISTSLDLLSDASAAIGITQRLGLGKVRHLSLGDLWVQQKVRNGELNVGKLSGEENTSDMMTKALARPRIRKLLKLLNVRSPSGASEEEGEDD